ncbi:COX15/CtaA family protein [Microbacterium marinilacus]|uniref:Heme A synthase n=1 Tax=Microbacterium marinilacus TaxID=415209 RepID=A0ABP7BIK2_9MICO|nr:COX15/CtaA family protein [Microbacterium marinilacus]MBY0690326.1 COX15/CtaA family protein [Microbacterium marinilacus]
MSADTAAPPAAPAAPAPAVLGRPLRVLAWLSFLAEVLIIGTGGAVRLTGSGLGCSEWPLCTPESIVPTQDLGIHGFIEFGNRTMTGVVGLLALAVLVLTLLRLGARRQLAVVGWFALGGLVAAGAVYAIANAFGAPAFVLAVTTALLACVAAAYVTVRAVRARRELVTLAWLVVIGVVAQGLVGGITVLTGLNPFIVGFHYTSSVVLVCVTAAYLVRAYAVAGPRERAVPLWFAVVTHVTTLVLAVTIAFGVLTTGNGPHSGDADVIRTGFDATVLAHVHAWPGYVLLALVLVLAVAAWMRRLSPRRWLAAVLVVIAVQVAVGVVQARNGLPELLVGIHMVLAALSAAAFTVVVLRLKRPVAAPAE